MVLNFIQRNNIKFSVNKITDYLFKVYVWNMWALPVIIITDFFSGFDKKIILFIVSTNT